MMFVLSMKMIKRLSINGMHHAMLYEYAECWNLEGHFNGIECNQIIELAQMRYNVIRSNIVLLCYVQT
jgi:hypothetical protein